jgi:amidase
LHGVPMTIKESYNFRGLPTTWGVPELAGAVADSNAVAVERLAAAGANVFGKTNVPINLGDFQSYNAIYGVTNNPWRLDRTPGGSSGGSAAALAAGLTALEIGSDIGGSIRNPAHYCGVFGHKPTWNLLPSRGHTPNGALTPADISVIGPLARSADDLELALCLMMGPDELEVSGVTFDLPKLEGPLSELRIGVWASDPICPTSTAVVESVRAVAAALAAQGATVDEDARPNFSAEHSHLVFSGLLLAAMSARMPQAHFEALVARSENLSPADQSPAALQTRWRTIRMRDWGTLNEQRTQLRWAWRRFFQDYDFLVTPVMPTTAFAHDHRPEGERTIDVDGQTVNYFSQTFWAGLAGVAYLPATVIPAGSAADGLPVGVQIIGPAYGDLRTIQLAQRLERLGFQFKQPPGY